MLSAGTVATILMGLITAKVWAIQVGPRGLGYAGLIQSLLGILGLIAGLGVSTGLVRYGAALATSEDARSFAALRWAAWTIAAVAGGLTMVVLLVFRDPVSRLFLGGVVHNDAIIVVAVALLLGLAANIQSGTLNAYHRVRALAISATLVSILGATAGIGIVLLWGYHGIPAAILAAAAASAVLPTIFVHRQLKGGRPRVTAQEVGGWVRRLSSFGTPYTLANLAGTGAQLAVPIVLLKMLSPTAVGYYRAAATVGIVYLSFLLTSMAQDYYPRASAVANDPGRLRELVNRQQRLVMLLGAPIILGALALAPEFVPILYSSSFLPASHILEWQLAGDLFRYTSWTMSFVILARGGGWIYFWTELIGGSVTLLITWLAVSHVGLVGSGVGYLAGYVAYLTAVWVVVRRDIGLTLDRDNVSLLLAGTAATGITLLLAAAGLAAPHLICGAALAIAFGAYSVRQLGWGRDGSRPAPV